MRIIEVKDKVGWKLFHKLPHIIYKDDDAWIAPIESDVQSIFDPQKNNRFENGEAKVFVALDEKNQPIGRLGAFIDHEKNSTMDWPIGGIGLFECINDQSVAHALFDIAKDYLSQFGVKGIEGPTNFGERDKYYGLQTMGYDHLVYQENYNPPYYVKLFQSYHFQPYLQMVTFYQDSDKLAFDKFGAIADRVCRRYPITMDRVRYSNRKKAAKDISIVYNKAFENYEHYKPIGSEVVLEMIEGAKPILDPHLTSLVYYDNQPAGVVAALPNITNWIKPLNGKFNKWRAPLFLWQKWTYKRPTCKGILSAVVPEYQKKGVYAVVINQIFTQRNVDKYQGTYMPSVMGHNASMVSTFKKLNCKIVRENIGYRLMLDSNVALDPFEFISLDKEQIIS